MKYAIVFSSVTGNTQKLAEAIRSNVDASYFGKPSDEAFDADVIFVGFWTTGNSCGAEIKTFLENLSGKKIFIFGTAGYNNTKEYFDVILDSVKVLVPESNTVVGTYMCQGKVSDTMQEKIKQHKPDMFDIIKEKLAESVNHPNEDDINALRAEIDKAHL